MKKLKPNHSKTLLYVAALVVVLLAMASLHNCSENKQTTDYTPPNYDTVDVAIEYSPLSFYTYNDTLGGFNYDLLNYIASRHRVALRFHPVTSLSQSLNNLAAGKYDLLVADIPMTADYRKRLNFLEPVMLDRQVLVQLRDSITGKLPVAKQLDLAGDTVWVIAGSSVADRIANLSREIGDTIHIEADSTYGAEQLVILTALGQIKHAVVNERVARQMLDDYPQLDASVSISFSQFQSWIAGNRRPWIADSLNCWIKEAKADTTYNLLTNRYLK
ncbi:MAG: transporter substrate-binding domain-containing protein [Muribaculum sp.]|nr:transporter substrate-binding domain-containing protein [Muribaculaceae bacterium]MCM1080820.1 transporter substrate-binding domain-containing protein [Muribaculum sp.]